jgi:hypothetical protein
MGGSAVSWLLNDKQARDKRIQADELTSFADQLVHQPSWSRSEQEQHSIRPIGRVINR